MLDKRKKYEDNPVSSISTLVPALDPAKRNVEKNIQDLKNSFRSRLSTDYTYNCDN